MAKTSLAVWYWCSARPIWRRLWCRYDRRGLAGGLHGRQEQGHQDARDRDDRQDLDQGEAASRSGEHGVDSAIEGPPASGCDQSL